MRKLMPALLAVTAASFTSTLSFAATKDDAQQAIARASASVQEAASLKNEWTTTTQALDEAKKAAEAGDADHALALAQRADALAKASIAQSKTEDQAWKNAVIK